MVEQQVVHLPERALVGRGLARLGRELGVRVDVVQRQVPPDVAEVAEVGEQLADDRLGLAAVGALEVAVLDDRDRRVDRAADVVALGSTSTVEVDERLGAAEQGADPSAPRQQGGGAEEQPGERATRTSAAARMPSFASSSSAPSNASVAMSSETVNPIPAIVPPPATAAQPTGGRSRPPAQPRRRATCTPTMPTGLPTT